MRTCLMIASAATAALLAGAALAQDAPANAPANAPASDTTVNPSSSNKSAPAPDAAAPPARAPSDSASRGASANSSDAATVAPAAGAPAERTTNTISSSPVPDTKENRERYGHPLSAAGRRTKPAGN
jgi:hypothetical protein